MEFNAMFDMMMGGVWNSNSEDYGYIYSVWPKRCLWHRIINRGQLVIHSFNLSFLCFRVYQSDKGKIGISAFACCPPSKRIFEVPLEQANFSIQNFNI